MNRRDCLRWFALAPCLQIGLGVAAPSMQRSSYQRLLVLVELKGGNDALNMLVPYADPLYYRLRPRIAVSRDEVLQLSDRAGLNPAMQALMPLWQAGELAFVQGLGYPQPNLSHFRSIEIWDTASNSDQYLQDGWLARAFAAAPPPRDFTADGVIVGSSDIGPLQGLGPRAIVLSNPEQFARQARLAGGGAMGGNSALSHLRKVESGIAQAATRLEQAAAPMRTEFPNGAFGNTVRTACRVLASGAGVAVLRLTQNGYDTHQNQPNTHANLLRQLSEGLVALRAGLQELGRWDDTLVMSYAEFGRRPKGNESNGTDHGTVAAHLVMGSRVRGGLYGQAPRLDQLDGDGNLRFTTDFRSLYATALQGWWGQRADAVLNGKYPPLDILRA